MCLTEKINIVQKETSDPESHFNLNNKTKNISNYKRQYNWIFSLQSSFTDLESNDYCACKTFDNKGNNTNNSRKNRKSE